MNKLPDSMKNVGEKIKNIEILNVPHELSAATIGNIGERKTPGELFSVVKSGTKGTGEAAKYDVGLYNEIKGVPGLDAHHIGTKSWTYNQRTQRNHIKKFKRD
ncbi:hypothetical protein [Bacillus mycoides]|nr:hypothetical protein [Bacillus mycoides]MED1041766.1 hypothetical protein [Bacillus mycoides]